MLGILRRLWPFVARYRGLYALGAACVILAAVLRMAIPGLLGSALDELRRGSVDDADQVGARITTVAFGIVAAAFAGALVRTTSRLCILGNSRRVVHDLRRDVLAKLTRLPPSFYVRHQVGHVMSRCVNDVQNVQGLTGPVTMYLVETVVLYAVGVAFMVAADPVLTLFGLLPFPFFLWVAHRLARRIQRGTREVQERLADLSAKVDESLSGHRVVRAMALEDTDRAAFAAAGEAYRDASLSVARDRATLMPLMLGLTALSTLLVLAIGGPRVVAGEATVGELFAMILYLGMVAMPTRILGFVLASLQRGTAAFERILELMDLPEGFDGVAAGAGVELNRGEIAIENLTVTFPPMEAEPHLSGSLPDAEDEGVAVARTVLREVSVRVPAGSTLGVVGPVGSGKSVLLRVLARQIEVDPGTVWIDGHDVTAMPTAAVRRAVGWVPQEPFLFGATVEENIAIGAADRTPVDRTPADPTPADPTPVDRAEVVAAARVAQLERDLDQLPKGLDTLLGDRGVNLSGGQRQRTALARVVVRRPALLLLDDCLSAVDADTADRILEGLRPVMDGRTTVIVAHRLATVRHADQILVLDEGRVVERGSHDELLAQNGLYAQMEREQRAQGGAS